MKFIFQESKIWEGSGNDVDPNGRRHEVKATSLEKALKKLPKNELGRNWIHVATIDNERQKEINEMQQVKVSEVVVDQGMIDQHGRTIKVDDKWDQGEGLGVVIVGFTTDNAKTRSFNRYKNPDELVSIVE